MSTLQKSIIAVAMAVSLALFARYVAWDFLGRIVCGAVTLTCWD